MALIAATDAIIPVEPRYLETVGLLSVIKKINDIRDGWRIPDLRVSGILVTKMDCRIKGHVQLLEGLKSHPILVSYAHNAHQSVFSYNPRASASKAYAEFVVALIRRMAQG